MKLSMKKLQDLKDGKIEFDELSDRYFIDSKDGIEVENILNLLNENICSFKQLFIDMLSVLREEYSGRLYQNRLLFFKFLDNEKLFKKLIKNNLLDSENLRYVLHGVNSDNDIFSLSRNETLIKYVLSEFILGREMPDKYFAIKFNERIEKNSQLKENGIYDIYDLIDSEHKDNEEILKLNRANKIAHQFRVFHFATNGEQKIELIELLKNNEITRNRLFQIVENHLEDNFNFDSLMNYLKKTERKNLMNI